MIPLPTGLRARLVITFTVVAVAASLLVATIGFELAKTVANSPGPGTPPSTGTSGTNPPDETPPTSSPH